MDSSNDSMTNLMQEKKLRFYDDTVDRVAEKENIIEEKILKAPIASKRVNKIAPSVDTP